MTSARLDNTAALTNAINAHGSDATKSHMQAIKKKEWQWWVEHAECYGIDFAVRKMNKHYRDQGERLS